MNKKELFSDVEKVLKDFDNYFILNPEIFASEIEVRNALFRFLLKALMHSNKYPEIRIIREYLANSKPRVRYDIAVIDERSRVLFAFELKYAYSDIKKLLTVLEEDIGRLERYSGEHIVRGYVLFYNNFEMYPAEVLNSIKEMKHSSRIDIRVINQTREKIKLVQEKYMMDYCPKYKA